jgi:hypothetical protein
MIYGEKLKNATISISASGNNTIIAAPSQGYIVVDNINFVPDSAVSMKLISGSTDLSGVYSLTANQGFTQDNTFGNQDGVITCGNEEALIINLSGAVQCSGFCRYRIIGE